MLLDYKITRKQSQYNQVTINIDKKDIQKLFKDLKNFDVKFLSEVKYSLEKHFIKIIENQKENKND